MSRLRIKPSRIEKLLRGLSYAGRYASAPAVALMLGCVPSLRPLSVSSDGRYVAVPYSHTSGNQEGTTEIAVLDLQTDAVRIVRPITEGFWWYSNTKDVIACFNPDSIETFNTAEHRPSVLIVAGDDAQTLEGAMLPSLSRDGRFVVYSNAPDGKASAYGNLTLYGVKKRDRTDLGVAGVFAEFSPDGQRILFAAKQDAAKDNGWKLYVMQRDGGAKTALADIDPETAKLFCPRWLDDRSIVFRTRTPQSPDDGELFIVDLKGNRQQLTDNDFDDVNPQVLSPDRIVYARAKPSGDKANTRGADLWIAERKDGKWRHRSLGCRACYFVATSKWLVYCDESGDVIRAPLDNPTAGKKLSDLVAQQAK